MKCIVTGAAGFIGSHLCEALVSQGHEVVGIDAFIPYYPRAVKESNLQEVRCRPRFAFVEGDLRTVDLDPLMDGVEVVFHLAAMPGLMRSWSDLDLYSSCNILATQRLLEAARCHSVAHFIHASTSSVYGRNADGDEASPLRPVSPYGVTKLAAEHLCLAYRENFGVPVTILRYFSVYGPRQRPDMGYHILIRSILEGRPFPLYGDGEQTRSNTFIRDCIAATLLAARRRDVALGETFNVGGGQVVSLNEVIALVEKLAGRKARIMRRPPRPGDQRHTRADIGKAHKLLGYEPTTPVTEGLRAQFEWQMSMLGHGP
ncbi:MAG TPA: NAD-dependent epimerase/dehydratase family protein [Kiritimatiellae bacterium]|nr:NAD-dependent epimerase/dehydratase family protein [Kiritimatiellia bacterium]